MKELRTVTITVDPEEIEKIEDILQKQGMNAVKKEEAGETRFLLALNEEEKELLEACIARYQLKSSIAGIAKAGAKAIVSGTEYIVKDVAVPVAKVGVSTLANATRIGAEASVIAASSFVNVVADQGKTAVKNIKKSNEYKDAKNEIKEAFKSVSKVFGFGLGKGIKIS